MNESIELEEFVTMNKKTPNYSVKKLIEMMQKNN